jgi:prolyl oligopeptidase
MHSLKYAATLQYTQPHNPHPHLLQVVEKAGHTFGRTTDMTCVACTVMMHKRVHFSDLNRIKLEAAKLGFLAQSLGLLWKDVTSVRSHA